MTTRIPARHIVQSDLLILICDNFHKEGNSIYGKLNLNEGSESKDSTDEGDGQSRLAAPVEGRVEVVLAHLVVADRVKLVKEGGEGIGF